MGAQAKKKGPVKGGKGGRKANKQSGETAPSWALEQLALEQDAADVEDESPEAEALAALLAQGCRDDVELATLALARAARLTMQSSKRHPELVRLRNGRRRHSEPVWIPRRLEWALPGALTRDTSYPTFPGQPSCAAGSRPPASPRWARTCRRVRCSKMDARRSAARRSVRQRGVSRSARQVCHRGPRPRSTSALGSPTLGPPATHTFEPRLGQVAPMRSLRPCARTPRRRQCRSGGG